AEDRARHHLFGWGVFIFGWLVTGGSLLALHRWQPDASAAVELTVLVVSNLVATATRFVGLRWIFRRRPATTLATQPERSAA
ncbi:MAG: glycosyltransferase family 2 protein, partial [Gordonia sp. (in: high G+C Gram-positive bacteria)]